MMTEQQDQCLELLSPEEVSKAGDQSRCSQKPLTAAPWPWERTTYPPTHLTEWLHLQFAALMPWSAHLVSPSYFSPFFPSFSYVCNFFSIDLFIPVFGIYKPLFLRVMRKKWSTFQKICDLNQIIISLQPKPSGDSVQNPREITHLNIRHPCNDFISKVNPCSNCAHVNMKYTFFFLLTCLHTDI